MRNYFVWLLLFAIVALAIYDVKYSVKDAHKVTMQMEAELLRERQRLSILEVEWAMLTRPERIKAMAQKHLPLLVEVNEVQNNPQNAAQIASKVSGINSGINSDINKVRFLEEEQAIWRISAENNAMIAQDNDISSKNMVTQDITAKNISAQNVNQIIIRE